MFGSDQLAAHIENSTLLVGQNPKERERRKDEKNDESNDIKEYLKLDPQLESNPNQKYRK